MVTEVGMRAQEEEHGHTEGDLDGGSGSGDQEALPAAQPRSGVGRITAEGLQGDAAGGSERAGGEGMAELMDQDGNKAGEDEESDFKNFRRRICPCGAAEDDEGDPEKGLDFNGDAKK